MNFDNRINYDCDLPLQYAELYKALKTFELTYENRQKSFIEIPDSNCTAMFIGSNTIKYFERTNNSVNEIEHILDIDIERLITKKDSTGRKYSEIIITDENHQAVRRSIGHGLWSIRVYGKYGLEDLLFAELDNNGVFEQVPPYMEEQETDEGILMGEYEPGYIN